MQNSIAQSHVCKYVQLERWNCAFWYYGLGTVTDNWQKKKIVDVGEGGEKFFSGLLLLLWSMHVVTDWSFFGWTVQHILTHLANKLTFPLTFDHT